jgi:hypothetical protein
MSMVEKATEVGRLLTDERKNLGHGEWLPWLRKNFRFTDRTARNYIRLFENRDRLKLESVSNLTEAYQLLNPPKSTTETIPESGHDDPELLATKTPRYFLPEFGCRFGSKVQADGTEIQCWIFPSAKHDGYWYVTKLIIDQSGGAEAEGLGEPIKAEGVGATMKWLKINHEDLEWEVKLLKPQDYNIWLFDSYDDWKETWLPKRE